MSEKNFIAVVWVWFLLGLLADNICSTEGGRIAGGAEQQPEEGEPREKMDDCAVPVFG